MNEHKNCLHCGQILRGRPDKKYCDDHCRSSYNNRQNTETSRVMRTTNHILRKNRQILAYLSEQAKEKNLFVEDLLDHGFNFRFFTHFVEMPKGLHYHACYDYSYRIIRENTVMIRKTMNIHSPHMVR